MQRPLRVLLIGMDDVTDRQLEHLLARVAEERLRFGVAVQRVPVRVDVHDANCGTVEDRLQPVQRAGGIRIAARA